MRRRDTSKDPIQYRLSFSASDEWPDLTMRIAGLWGQARRHYDQIRPGIMARPLRAMLKKMDGGSADLEDICACLQYRVVTLAPLRGAFSARAARVLACDMVDDVHFESDCLYAIDVTPAGIRMELVQDYDYWPTRFHLDEMVEEMKRACRLHGFRAQRRPRHSYRLLDVWGPGGMTRWLAVGKRDAERIDVPKEVAALVAIDDAVERVRRNPSVGERAVLTRARFLERIGHDRIEACLAANFRGGGG